MIPEEGPPAMAAEQVELQRFERVRRDLDIGEGTEARIDAIRGLIAERPPLDDGSRRVDALARVGCQRDRLAIVGDPQKLLNCQGRTVQLNHLRVES